MDVKQVDESMYRIELDDKEEAAISVWAHYAHIENEMVIEEWLSKAIEQHSPPESNPQNDTEHGTETLSM